MRVIEKLINSLKDENPEVRDYAVNSLAKIGKAANPAAIQPLLEILNNKKEYGWIRGQAAYTLACINPEESITPLIQKLTEEDIRLRQGLVNALGEIGKKAVPLLLVALSNENNDVRKGFVPDADAVRKIMFLADRDIMLKWTMPLPNWANILNQLAIRFEGRISI